MPAMIVLLTTGRMSTFRSGLRSIRLNYERWQHLLTGTWTVTGGSLLLSPSNEPVSACLELSDDTKD